MEESERERERVERLNAHCTLARLDVIYSGLEMTNSLRTVGCHILSSSLERSRIVSTNVNFRSDSVLITTCRRAHEMFLHFLNTNRFGPQIRIETHIKSQCETFASCALNCDATTTNQLHHVHVKYEYHI